MRVNCPNCCSQVVFSFYPVVVVDLREGVLRILRPIPSPVWCPVCNSHFYAESAKFLHKMDLHVSKDFLKKLLPLEVREGVRYIVDYDFVLEGPAATWVYQIGNNREKWKNVQVFDEKNRLIFLCSRKTR